LIDESDPVEPRLQPVTPNQGASNRQEEPSGTTAETGGLQHFFKSPKNLDKLHIQDNKV
jgi:hypothetical protein